MMHLHPSNQHLVLLAVVHPRHLHAGVWLSAHLGGVRRALEQKLFTLGREVKIHLRSTVVSPELEDTFKHNGIRLITGTTISACGDIKWLVRSGPTVYALRDEADGVNVSRVHYPGLSRIIDGLTETINHVRWHLTARLRTQARMTVAMLRKRTERPEHLRVNVGAGPWYVRGWKTLDHSAGWYRYLPSFVDYDHDLTSRLPMPFPTGSVQSFYCEHVLEHLTDDCCRHVIAEMFRALAPGGELRLVVPDADLIYRKFEDRDEGFFATLMGARYATLTDAFLTLIAHPRTPVDENELARNFRSLPKAAFLDTYTGPMQYDYERAGEHINWFNFEKLSMFLRDAGFRRVELSMPQNSRFPSMRGAGFDTRPTYSLHIEAVKESQPQSSGPMAV